MESEKRLETEVKIFTKKFLESIKNKPLQVISHFDTDGITSAAIMVQALKRLDKQFDLRIVKNLTKEIIQKLSKQKVTLFLDLASGSLKELSESGIKNIFIVDHHEVPKEIPENLEIINPEIFDKRKISGSGMTYLFCREIDEKNKDSAKLAILGTIGDSLEGNLDALNHGILEDSEIQRKRGLMIYPSTRPLNRTIEYSSDPFIPGVTGNHEGVIELLREARLSPENGKYKSLIELTDEETQRLVTAILLRNPEIKNKELLGDLFLIKMFGKLEDARELSAKINACSRNGETDIALRFCLEDPLAKKKVEAIHVRYKQQLLSGIKYIQEEAEKIQGKGYIILNAKDKIKDTMIGTITSILSHSPIYDQETIIIGMAYDQEKIKISARSVGRKGRNIREVLATSMLNFNGEFGGHEFAAGATIKREDD
jgi:RecJ-like exonuclease